LSILQRVLAEPAPEYVFEITEAAISAASSRRPAQPSVEILEERGLSPSPSTPNLLKPQLYRDALARISAVVRPKRARTALVIPDYAARMAILDFEEFPASEAERTALLRFRLRKSVPFPIDEAQLSYAVQLNEPRRIEVLAVVIARPILHEYESIFTEAGFRVGMVTPSSIAALPLCMKPEKGLMLLAKAAGPILSVFLLDASRVRLVRCLDMGDVEGGALEAYLVPVLHQTLAFAEDQIGTPVGRVLLCGFGARTEVIGRNTEQEFGVPYSPVGSRFGAASPESAGLLGLLEQYAA
jgi:type IV pilus assembly protein PilM